MKPKINKGFKIALFAAITQVIIGVIYSSTIGNQTAFAASNGENKSVKPSEFAETEDTPNYAISVSLVNLIATPEKFHGKAVAVSGVYMFGSKSVRLYFSKEDYDYKLTLNSIELDLNGVDLKEAMKSDGQLVACFLSMNNPEEKLGKFRVFIMKKIDS